MGLPSAVDLLGRLLALGEGLLASVQAIRLAARGAQVGPFLNSGYTCSVPGNGLTSAPLYRSRSFPAVLVVQVQATGTPG